MSKSFQYYVRVLHRNLGFFAFGLIIFYSLSGIILIYRDVDFMKQDVAIEKIFSTNLSGDNLISALKLKNVKVASEDSITINFTNGTYSKVTGIANYTTKEVIFPFNKFINLHKATSQSPVHWFTVLFGVILFLLGISSLWMFKSSTKQFKRGILVALAGTTVAILLLFIV